MDINSEVTGDDVITRALQLLGYTNGYGEVDPAVDAELYKRAAAAVRQVYDDLQRLERRGDFDQRVIKMNEPVPLAAAIVRDIMPYGVAMFLAQSESSCDAQALFASMYNRKRSSVPRTTDRRADVLPRGGH